jgi:transcriptional regulator with GAF, ATPase, and Fis domain
VSQEEFPAVLRASTKAGAASARTFPRAVSAAEGGALDKAAVQDAAVRLLSAPPHGLDFALQESLEALARALDVDRCAVAQFKSDGRTLTWTHGFDVPGIPAWPARDLAPLLPWYAERVREGRPVALSRLPQDLPAELEAEADRVRASGLKALLGIPLRSGGQVLGALGVGCFRAPRSWSPEVVVSLELVASAMASGLQRRQAAERQRAAEELSRSILAAVPDPLLVLDDHGCVTHVSGAWSKAPRCPDCPDDVWRGANYLEALKRTPPEHLEGASALADGVRAVLEGRQERFETTYRCHRSLLDRRFRMTVSPVAGGGALVVRTDVSQVERLKAELDRAGQDLREFQERIATGSRKEEPPRAHGFDEIVGTSAALSKVLRQIEQVASADSPVLILGETGTGKDLVARAVHARSRRKGRPLVAVNCAALPDALIESELFGYEKGAFTGAVSRTIGRFETADGGSILLDEIGDMPLAVQAKLLRVLEGGTFERLGSSRSIRVNVRVLAATNRDLEKEVREGRFRADLYYRLNVFPITVPPLRARSEDVPLLVWHFIDARQGALGRRIERVPDRLMRALEAHAWPGNVRELENLIERALIVSDSPTLSLDAPLFPAVSAEAAAGPSLDAVQRAHIEAVLRECGWKVAGKGNAADRLGLKRGTLQFRMKKLGIRRPASG